MPQDKDFKRLVRQRVSETGERYTEARLALMRQRAPERSPRREVDGWLTLLSLPGVPGQENEGFVAVQSLPPDECRTVALRGMHHESWRVRRRCAQVLDDLTLTDATIAALTAALHDEHPQVRRAALHSLICVHCKPDGCAMDARSIAESMLDDPSAEVRRMAIGAFWTIDNDVIDLLRRVATTDRSARVRKIAENALRWKELQVAGNKSRHELPDELRRKTERHRGKWVGIADGRIICAHGGYGQVRRDLKGTAHSEAVVVWVGDD